jgi:hypothetical protein
MFWHPNAELIDFSTLGTFNTMNNYFDFSSLIKVSTILGFQHLEGQIWFT